MFFTCMLNFCTTFMLNTLDFLLLVFVFFALFHSDRSFFKSIRVFRGAEPPANSDHRLVVATAALQPYRATRKSFNLSSPSSTLHC